MAEFDQLFKIESDSKLTVPEGFMHLSKYRLLEIYTSVIVVIATGTFGMRFDCPYVRQVILWGPAGDIESHIQSTCRAGQDGLLCFAHFFKKSTSPYFKVHDKFQ